MSTRPSSTTALQKPGGSLFASHEAIAAMWRSRIQAAPHRLPEATAHAALALRAIDPSSLGLWRDSLPAPLRSMAPRRLQGFLAGRLCAEAALEQLGYRSTGVGRGPAGEPTWPSGVVGSIAHTDDSAYAVARRAGPNDGLGIDSEPLVTDVQILAALRSECCTARESGTLFDGVEDALTATIVFSAKEALYKAIYPRVQRLVEFTEVEVSMIDRAHGAARLGPAASSSLRSVVPAAWVPYCVLDGVVHASVLLGPVR